MDIRNEPLMMDLRTLNRTAVKDLPGYIAGGSVRRAYLGLPTDNCDIDIFLDKDKMTYGLISTIEKATGAVLSNKRRSLWESDHPWKGPSGQTYKLQVICEWKVKSCRDLLDQFDYSASMYGMRKTGDIMRPRGRWNDRNVNWLVNKLHGYSHQALVRALKFEYQGSRLQNWHELKDFLIVERNVEQACHISGQDSLT